MPLQSVIKNEIMITYIVISSNKEIPDLEDLEIAKILDTIQ